MRNEKGQFVKGYIPWSKGKNKREFLSLARPNNKLSKLAKERAKIANSQRMKGNKLTLGREPWNKGKKWLEMKGENNPSKRPNIRKILSEQKRGKNNPRWKGGITSLRKSIRNSFKYRQWRSDIFTRDNFTCVICGKRGGYLEADHYPKRFSDIIKECNIKILEQALECEELWNINNGRTLCRKCHDKNKKK